ncbi:RNase adapter RapZ [Gryllotalpicola sp.]|uniref:RNase adapter RapZ n=1 Tax=Gryllotalpicola sp. TaxID=1932787 RepID=UPI0026164CD4|nr:RNase adapter RapZ [Gryllotalpicola sp.]
MADDTPGRQELLIISGMSGAGRSTVANALEDIDWYVVDNLPPLMLKPLLDLAARAGLGAPRVAAVVDVRGRDLFFELLDLLPQLRENFDLHLVFLDADDDTLVRRFESVRRPHPLQGNGTLVDAIQTERSRLHHLRERADIIIDTSSWNVHELASNIAERFAEASRPGVQVTVESFGFKYGIPADADLVADVRFLPNPYWIPELRAFDGTDEAVHDYVFAQPGAAEFVAAYLQAVSIVLRGYQTENKRNALIAIGCTGGKHRSVAIVEELAKRIATLPGVAVNVKHRDLGRE